MRAVAELVPLFRRQFELCRVRVDESVALLVEPSTRADYVDAAAAAAGTLGASVFEVGVPALGWSAPAPVKGMGAGVPVLARPNRVLTAVTAALREADFVVDLLPETIIHVDTRLELQRQGVRILTVVEPPEMLERLFPPPGIKEAVLALGERLSAAGRLRATSPQGTDLEYRLPRVPCVTQYGYADEPGRWDHWPSALVNAYPVEGGVDGRLVITPGSILFPFKRHVQEPMTLEIRSGYVVDIEGGTEAILMRDYLERWNEPEVFAVSHVGMGLLPRASWSALAFFDRGETLGQDGRSVQGNLLFSTGPNRFTGRHVEAHFDIPTRGCTIVLDEDEVVVEDGRLIASEFLTAPPAMRGSPPNEAMQLGLEGKVALVTAASRGIGFATATALAHEGARVAICARSTAGVTAAGEELRRTGADVLAVPGDLAAEADVDRLVQAVLGRWGTLDLLVSNTGGPPTMALADTLLEDWDQAWQHVARPAIQLALTVVPIMRRAGSGRIVFLTSTWVKQPRDRGGLSAVARSAVSALAKQLASELAEDGILVNQVLPGPTDTDRMAEIARRAAQAQGISEEQYRSQAEREMPMGRPATPDEIAAAVVFLLSAPASYVTGVALPVDGGQIRSTL